MTKEIGVSSTNFIPFTLLSSHPKEFQLVTIINYTNPLPKHSLPHPPSQFPVKPRDPQNLRIALHPQPYWRTHRTNDPIYGMKHKRNVCRLYTAVLLCYVLGCAFGQLRTRKLSEKYRPSARGEGRRVDLRGGSARMWSTGRLSSSLLKWRNLSWRGCALAVFDFTCQ